MQRTLSLLGALALTAACGGTESSVGVETDGVASVTVAPAQAGVEVGGTVQLSATVRGPSGDVLTRAVSWSVQPAGIVTVDDGLVTGVAAGDATVTASAGGKSGAAVVSVTDPSNPPPGTLAVTTETLPPGITGQAYSVQLAAAGGDGSYLWNLVLPGGLPSGFALGATTGIISGTPASPSTSGFTVQVSSAGLTATRAFTLQVYNPLVINNTSLAVGKVGQSYNQTVTAGGGDTSYQWTVSAGQLPAGITLSVQNGDALLAGTPTVAGSQSVTLQVTSGDGQTAVRSYTFTVNP